MISLTLLYVTINDIATLNELSVGSTKVTTENNSMLRSNIQRNNNGKTQDTTCYPLEIIRHHLRTTKLIQQYFNIVPTATDNRPLTVVMGKQEIPGDLS